MEIEVSLKVRSAIKAKLLELGVHVDEELPDYVMVLVANRRSKSQMDSDLSLFLGENTIKFTTWLSHVLKKLEQVTMGNVTVDVVNLQKTEPSSSSSNKKSEEQASVKKSDDQPPAKKSESDAKSGSNKKSDVKSSSSKEAETGSKSRHQKSESSKTSSHDDSKKKTSSPKKPVQDSRVKFVLRRPLPGQTIEKPSENNSPEKEKKSMVQSEPDSSSAKAPVVEIQPAESSSSGAADVLNLGIEEEDEPDQEFALSLPAEDKVSKTNTTAAIASAADDAAELRELALRSSTKRKISRAAVDNVKHILEDEDERARRVTAAKKSKHNTPPPRERESRHRPTTSTKLRSQVTVPLPPPSTFEEYDPAKPTIKSSVVCVNSRLNRRGTHEANRNLIFKAMRDAEADKLRSSSRRKERSPSPARKSRSRSPIRGSESKHRRRERESTRQETRPNKKSIKERLGVKAETVVNDYVYEEYEQEEEEMEMAEQCHFNPEKDYTLVVHVQNTPRQHYQQRSVLRYEVEEELDDEPAVVRQVTQPPQRFSIQLDSSEEEDSESECTELKSPRGGVMSDAELEVTVPRDDQDLPMPPSSTEASPAVATAPASNRLADLRAKLAALTKPLSIPSPVQAPVPAPAPTAPKKFSTGLITGVKFAPVFGGAAAPGFVGFGASAVSGAGSAGFGTICKYWPACSFSNNCKFKHPVCKYGSRCTKPGCAYKHNAVELKPTPKVKVCSWFPACHNMSCPFLHPKVCRFATNCTDRACTNWHPGRSVGKDATALLPQKNQLKWTKK